MPDHTFERHLNTILGEDLLAQLRTAGCAMSTTELRGNALHQPLRPGSPSVYPPLQERVYRTLCRLAASGHIVRHSAAGRTVAWSAVCDSAAADEINWLQRTFHAPAHSCVLAHRSKGEPS